MTRLLTVRLPIVLGVVSAGLACSAGRALPPVAPQKVASAPSPAPAAASSVPAISAALDPEGPALAWWRESMRGRERRLAWWREARFGMFIHWGVYSHLGGVWRGEPVKGYAEHIQRMKKIPIDRYRQEVAGVFNPTAFDAEAWVRAAVQAGMGYFIITAKHHDGFAMYDSAVSDYDIVEATPFGRDPMAELAAACRRQGVRFGFYYSHAFDWGDAEGPGNDWEFENPGGDLLHGGREWYRARPDLVPQVRRYVDRKAIPQLRELIRKYKPDILWFDTPHKLPPEENLRILQAVRAAAPEVVINGRAVQVVAGGPEARYGDYASTADRPAEFPPHDGDWEGIPTTNESYGWHREDHSHKPAAHFIGLLAKAGARGGNLLLNIGPRGDGTFDPKDLAILQEVGRWMEGNGVAVRGTVRSPLPVQAWGESTLRPGHGGAGDTLYLHVLDWPRSGRLVVGGLKSQVKKAHRLADPAARALRIRRLGPLDVEISLPRRPPDPANTVVALALEGRIDVDPRRRLGDEVAVDTLRAFDAELRGPGLEFGAGKTRDAWVRGWSDPAASVVWPVRLEKPTAVEVTIEYDAPERSAGGSFEVRLGETSLTGTVRPGTQVAHPLGKVVLGPAVSEIAVHAVSIAGDELLRLRGLKFRAASRSSKPAAPRRAALKKS